MVKSAVSGADMYGLPSGTDLNFLKGRTLSQACFGPFDLILNFDENVSISIWSALSLGQSEASPRRHSAFAEVSREVLGLLEKAVLEVGWTPSGTVSLTFEGDQYLELYDDNVGYESYSISGPAGLIVV
jgi:hypothetical protein